MSMEEAQPIAKEVPMYDAENAAVDAEPETSRTGGRVVAGIVGGITFLTLCLHHATAAHGMSRKIPQTLGDFMDNLPFYSFLVVTLSVSLRQALAPHVEKVNAWAYPAGLAFFCCLAVLPIVTGALAHGYAKDAIWFGSGCALVSALVSQFTNTNEGAAGQIVKFCNIAAGFGLLVGVTIESYDPISSNVVRYLPMIAYIAVGFAYYFFTFNKEWNMCGDFTVMCFILIMCSRVVVNSVSVSGTDDWESWCRDVGAICALVYVATLMLEVRPELRPLFSLASIGLLWVPLCLHNAIPADAKDFFNHSPFYAFSATILICSIKGFLNKKDGSFGDVSGMMGRHLFCVCFYAIIWAAHPADATMNTVADIGCICGLVAAVLEGAELGKPDQIDLLCLVCQVCCGLGLLLG